MNTLSWNTSPAAELVTSYKVYERVGTAYNLAATVTTTTYVLGALSVGAHVFAVTAINTAGESPKSNEVTATIALGVPSAPINLRIV